jgi:hypothetical protein
MSGEASRLGGYGSGSERSRHEGVKEREKRLPLKAATMRQVEAQAGWRVVGEHRHLSGATIFLPLDVATTSAHVRAAPV